MKTLDIKAIDVFTTKPFCGNPAGVLLDSDGLPVETMQKIASEMKMNLIEIAFVSSAAASEASFRVRYFTPIAELDVSGHVTIAVCYALIEDDRITLSDGVTRLHLETNIGNVPVEIHFFGDSSSNNTPAHDERGVAYIRGEKHSGWLEKIMMYQHVQRFRPSEIPVEDVAAVLGIEKAAIAGTGLPMVTATCDLDWLIIPVQHKEQILNMKPDLIKLGMLNRAYGIRTNHVFSLDTFGDGCITYSRHFGPAVGLWEDPGSAMASAGLGAYLLTYGVTTSRSMIMEQGKEIDSLSRITVEIDRQDGGITAVRVGGLAVTSITRTIDIESGELLNV